MELLDFYADRLLCADGDYCHSMELLDFYSDHLLCRLVGLLSQCGIVGLLC